MSQSPQDEATNPEASNPAVTRPGLRAELADAVTARTVAMVAAVLLLQLGFILSYVGAFHSPKPHHISLAVIAPTQAAAQVVRNLNSIPGAPLKATVLADEATARSHIKNGSLSSALIINPTATTDTLLTATAGGTSVATAVEQVLVAAETRQQRTVTITDVVSVQAGDARGLTGFYLVIGWIVGGYLVAALLGVAKGAQPVTTRRAAIRLTAVLPYAVLSGLGGTLIVDQVLHALTGHFLALWWLGVLLVLAAATVTMAFQRLLGVIGIGLTVLVFVVLGNPSAGGAYQPALLPPFWRALNNALPNGAGTDAVRNITYFGGHNTTGHLILIASYAIAGAAITLTTTALRTIKDPARA